MSEPALYASILGAPNFPFQDQDMISEVGGAEALKLRLDLNLEVDLTIKAKVNGDITLSLL
ncbi:hypothetical protein EDD85DRAFT_847089 [Armillaria nabsnona]|nr:hypothetical protein EDD85DRAFT_847089 [Armillaria nabsnona]